MKPDLELDALDAMVAERIMGWRRKQHLAITAQVVCWVTSDGKPATGGWMTSGVDVWRPSRWTNQAFQVVARVREKWPAFTLTADEKGWSAGFGPETDWEFPEGYALAETPEQAICKAALRVFDDVEA